MRAALIFLVFCAACAEAQQSGVDGVVIDRSTGQPLAGVHVRMVTGDFGNGGVSAVYGAVSDRAGHFSAENIKAGFYLVIGDRPGFVQLAASPTSPLAFATLTLKAGQRVTDLKVEMTPRALIAGRVVDDYGDPVENVSVQSEPVPPATRQESIFGITNTTTDDRGEFRLIVPPGKYYVEATPRNGRGNPPEVRTDGTSAAPLAETYYPSAPNSEAAAVVQAAPGQDIAGIEIRLTRSAPGPASVRGLTISGVVSGAPGNAASSVTLRYGVTAGQLNNNWHSTTTGTDGKFTFSGMQPGYYSAVAHYFSGKTSLQSRAVNFHLAADEAGLQLVLAPGEELTGTVELLGEAPAGESPKHTVRLQPADNVTSFGETELPAAEVGKDGAFRIPNVPAGKFKAIVEPMPDDGYVKTITLDNKPAADEVLDLSQGAGGSRVKITVGRTGGRISGTILGKDGEPALGLVMVVLETAPKEMDEDHAARVSDGKYSFKRIRPGKYRLFALDMLELMAGFAGGDEEEFMKSFFTAAEEVEIKDGDRISKDITVFTKLPEKK